MKEGNEQVITECRRSLTSFIPAIIFALLFFLCGFSYIGDNDKSGGYVSFFIAACIVIHIIIAYTMTYIRLTNRRVIGHVGFINSARIASPHSKVGDITTKNGLLGKILHYHTVIVTTSAGSKYKFRGMAHAVDFADEVQDYLDKA